MAAESDRRLARGEPRPLEGIPLAIKDLFCTRGHQDDRGLADPAKASCRRTNRLSRPTCGGRARSCSVRPTWMSLRWARPTLPATSDRRSILGLNLAPRRRGSRRQLRRLGRGGRGGTVPGRHWHRYRRLDPPAGFALRHRRHEADLRPLLALWHRRVRELARSGRAADPDGQGLRAAAAADGRLRPERQHQRRPRAARPRGGADRRRPRPQDRHPQGIPDRRLAARDRPAVAAGRRPGCKAPAAQSAKSACRTPSTRCRPTTSSTRPRRHPTSPATTACAMGSGSRART